MLAVVVFWTRRDHLGCVDSEHRELEIRIMPKSPVSLTIPPKLLACPLVTRNVSVGLVQFRARDRGLGFAP